MLTIMRGIPGSGKSTIARRLAAATGAIVVSSDGIRAELYGNEAHQGNPKDVFFLVRCRVAQALEQKLDVIVDTTGISINTIRPFIIIAETYGARHLIIEVRPALAVSMNRNANRSRFVPEDVIERMYRVFNSKLAHNEPMNQIVDWVDCHGNRIEKHIIFS